LRAVRRTDGQTDMTKVIVTFHNFVNEPKNDVRILYTSIYIYFTYLMVEYVILICVA